MLNRAVINTDMINIVYALKQPHWAGSTAVGSSLDSSLTPTTFIKTFQTEE